MKKDVTTFTRYILILLIVFLVWLFLLHKMKKDDIFMNFFGGTKSSSLSIIKR
jgi:preprotein translocase subunit SecG